MSHTIVNVRLVYDENSPPNLSGLADVLVNWDGIREVQVSNTYRVDEEVKVDVEKRVANADRYDGVAYIAEEGVYGDEDDEPETTKPTAAETRAYNQAARQIKEKK